MAIEKKPTALSAVSEDEKKKSVKPSEVKPEVKAASKKKSSPTIHTATTLLWGKLDKADTSGIKSTIAIQVEIAGHGTFYIEVKEGGKAINQTEYIDRSGTLCASLEEVLKIAEGGYNYSEALKSGKINYYGDLAKALSLIALLK